MSTPQVWFITGSSTGLGRAATEYALAQEDIVVATARNPDSLKDLSSRYPPTQFLPLQLDVLNKVEIKAAFAEVVKRFGRIDIVYSNSGITVLGEIESVEDELARKQFEVNFWGPVNVAKEAIRVFRDVNSPAGGRLLVASSIAGVNGIPALGYFSASKFAIEGFHESLSKELDPSWNIKVTILEFGAFQTRGLESMTASTPLPAYNATAAAYVRNNLKYDEKTPLASTGAKLIFEVAKDKEAPLRVPVGMDSIQVSEARGNEAKESTQYGQRFSRLVM
ncbi:hypothetical protein DL96DRAFT_1757217 [Flagelloscypha sp. PMI_526]|nr:hypothetical protein DL96DRAFT_1757217 [Flagelloscypha sp. PMI_526]